MPWVQSSHHIIPYINTFVRTQLLFVFANIQMPRIPPEKRSRSQTKWYAYQAKRNGSNRRSGNAASASTAPAIAAPMIAENAEHVPPGYYIPVPPAQQAAANTRKVVIAEGHLAIQVTISDAQAAKEQAFEEEDDDVLSLHASDSEL